MRRILFIEDEEYELDGLIKGLERRRYDVHVEHWTTNAIEHLRQNRYDLIVLNLELLIKGPGRNLELPDDAIERGVYLLKFIRNNMRLATPIIILSGHLNELRSEIEHLKNSYGISKALKKSRAGYADIISVIEEVLSNSQPSGD